MAVPDEIIKPPLTHVHSKCMWKIPNQKLSDINYIMTR